LSNIILDKRLYKGIKKDFKKLERLEKNETKKDACFRMHPFQSIF